MSDLSHNSQMTRRGLLARNAKAIAAIAAGALVSRVAPAIAKNDYDDRGRGGNSRHDSRDNYYGYDDRHDDNRNHNHGNDYGFNDHDGDRNNDHHDVGHKDHRGHGWGHDGGDRGHGWGDHGGHSGGGHSGGACFLKGTKIQTVGGERRVEDLKVGDLLPTVFGGARPIQWIIRFKRTKAEADMPWANHALPIRIMKSALGPNVPHADLFVTSGHALLLDGVLVTAKSLINGGTIAPYAPDECAELQFFNIKLETHDAIFAEGAACETLLKLDATDVDVPVKTRAGTLASKAYCAPIYGNGAYSEIKWRARSALSRWIGPHKVDVIRVRIEERSQVALLER